MACFSVPGRTWVKDYLKKHLSSCHPPQRGGTDIDGSYLSTQMPPERAPASCTTICLCKSIKDLVSLLLNRLFLFCGCKGTNFLTLHQTFSQLFCDKIQTFFFLLSRINSKRITSLLFIYARNIVHDSGAPTAQQAGRWPRFNTVWLHQRCYTVLHGAAKTV